MRGGVRSAPLAMPCSPYLQAGYDSISFLVVFTQYFDNSNGALAVLPHGDKRTLAASGFAEGLLRLRCENINWCHAVGEPDSEKKIRYNVLST